MVVAQGAPRSSRLWLLAPGWRGVQGSVARVTPDTLYLTNTKPSRPSEIALSRTAIREAYVHSGRASRPGQVLRAVTAGALMFGAQGALSGQVIDGRVKGTQVGTMAGIGAVLGAVLGATSPLDRWRRVRL